MGRAYRRSGVIVGVMLTLVMRFISSDVVLILNKLTPPRPLFATMNDVSLSNPRRLRWGMISPHTVWHAAQNCGAPARDRIKFHKELAWREFSYHLLHSFPDLASQNFNKRYDEFPWLGESKCIDAWKAGKTGYPLVDAGMRQLWHTSAMHNRVRMVTASFLVKHLLVDWRVGEKWFWDTLIDADPASNTASWQWVAGCGADAAPYFRVFNPLLQSRKFDPDGEYIRRWIPELAKLPSTHIHAPFEAPGGVLENAGVELGETYPAPIVDHQKARKRALAAYDAIKKDV